MSIKNDVEKKLSEIEEKENVKIIFCAESGSRAWDIASPDSDYDVRFVYVRRAEDYLSLRTKSDVIEWEINKVWDVVGWDIRKVLFLLMGSNPTVFEWNSSPIIYRKTPEWDCVREIIGDFFCPKKELYHYLGMAKKNYDKYLQGEDIDLKKYFYVLRSIFSCRWIIDKGTPPPIPFSEVFDAHADDFIRKTVENLYDRKINNGEMTSQKAIPLLNEYIEDLFAEIEKGIEGAEEVKGDVEILDKVFMKILRESGNGTF